MADVQGPGIVRLYYDAVGQKDGTPWAVEVETFSDARHMERFAVRAEDLVEMARPNDIMKRLASDVHVVDVEGRTRPFGGKYVLEFDRAIVVWGRDGRATICPYPKTALVP